MVEGQERQAGQTIGDIKVEIANRKGEKISKLPTDRTMASSKKLLVELKVIWHCKLHFLKLTLYSQGSHSTWKKVKVPLAKSWNFVISNKNSGNGMKPVTGAGLKYLGLEQCNTL